MAGTEHRQEVRSVWMLDTSNRHREVIATRDFVGVDTRGGTRWIPGPIGLRTVAGDHPVNFVRRDGEKGHFVIAMSGDELICDDMTIFDRD